MIDIIGSGGEDSQKCSAASLLFSFDCQADLAILCEPRLMPLVIPREIAGAHSPFGNQDRTKFVGPVPLASSSRAKIGVAPTCGQNSISEM